ncbi:MAG: DUF1501 domain-containing protein [Nannocystaceae bacterium]
MANLTRRSFTLRTSLGLGRLAMASVATGVPAWFLSAPQQSTAQLRRFGDDVDPGRAQLLVLSTAGAGDPLNANAPGTYAFPDIVHPADPSMAETPLRLGDVETSAAQVWSTLPQWVLDRTAFVHHSTPTQIHTDHPKVLELMERAAQNEGMLEMFARYLAPTVGTLLDTPVSAGAGPVLKANGRTIANQNPTLLRDLLAQPEGPLTNLATLRDATLDKIHLELKANGTPDQRAFLDNVATSRDQARNLANDVVSILGEINDNRETGQLLAAIALLKLKLSSTIAIDFAFGRDNHADPGLADEIAQHQTGVAAIAQLMERLRAEGLAEQTTFAIMNVFGRTLVRNGLEGRDHWKNHHVSLIVGRNVRAGVYGGIKKFDNGLFSDYTAMDINPDTGAGEDEASILLDDTFFGVAKTLGRALGIHGTTLDANLAPGQAISAALT